VIIMSLTNDAENQILNALFRSGGIYASKYFCLFKGGSSIEADLETGGATAMAHELTELSVGYARLSKPLNSPFGAAVGGVLTSDENIEFAKNIGDDPWEEATHFGIVVSGALVFWGSLETPVSVTVGSILRIPIGGLIITLN